ncbi:hypothetical protein OLMES_0466 [Oleiphilus messinensis]|uniref:Uncharacterized protein n=1 Tax=Oleiphilus messinensis TaxID=141451 RepID=A0A1Y0I2T4_9GAMM|nr:hypothetical protein OLMES_0466 [Oleiphilus messinensis]
MLKSSRTLSLENFHSQLATDFHWLNEAVLDCNNAYKLRHHSSCAPVLVEPQLCLILPKKRSTAAE